MSIRDAKLAFLTHRVPTADMAGIGDAPGDPEAGDLVVGEVLTLGQHAAIEDRGSRRVTLFPGDLLVGAFGSRYATDQFEGYVGRRAPVVHVLSIGGVCGQVRSQNDLMKGEPTKLRFRGFVLGPDGAKLNLKAYGMRPLPMPARRPKTVVVVGASMNSGKTTTVASAVRGLHMSGYRVAAAKITGTACKKDTWLMHDAGAVGIYDFSDCGYPSTYLLPLEELKSIHRAIVSNLAQLRSDVVLVEIADGLFQRETRMLLTDADFRGGVDHVLFAGVDSLSVESGVRLLGSWGYGVAATSGLVSCSALGIKESEAAAPGVPCLNARALAAGGLLPRLGLAPRLKAGARSAASSAVAASSGDAWRLDLVKPRRAGVLSATA